MSIHSVLRTPVITEKSARLQDAVNRIYTVKVSSRATKPAVRTAFETLFGVKVDSVRIMNVPGKTRFGAKRQEVRKRAPVRKALITLKKGEKAVDFLAAPKA